MFIQEQVVVAKMAPTHMPVEVLSLYVKSEHVGKQFAENVGDLLNRILAEVRGDFKHTNSHLSPPLTVVRGLVFKMAPLELGRIFSFKSGRSSTGDRNVLGKSWEASVPTAHTPDSAVAACPLEQLPNRELEHN